MDTKEIDPSTLIYQAMLLHVFSQLVGRTYEDIMAEFNSLSAIDQEKYLEDAQRLCELETIELNLDPWGEIEKYLHLLNQQENKPSSKKLLISSN
jgi:hypothetical protein